MTVSPPRSVTHSGVDEIQMVDPLEQSNAQDPHLLPTFDTESFSTPKFYLPPLLSSLPKNVLLHQHSNPKFSPIVTETRLPNIDPASLSLHKALHHFKPLTPSYASVPYSEAFNWSELVLSEKEEREWYCVVFRSKRKPGSDDIALYSADKVAHEEAISNGGLILYWYGIPHPETGLNLATCIWQSRKHATAANSRPNHIKAMRLAAQSYDIYTLERYILRKVSGDVGVSIKPFEGGEVGW
ncbi:hypothetical protein GALMADRAFT_248717 [Galerina marginata CBS 339.88]|uniref:Uncharacterized protein n=1 Tax=Galerina marginata (strain CBS 339.88) TaxID=685588 RepID=A0A067T0T9_GALM3|nr:hypothetical protein GALMADRAFT_248717 [Galerina marginata CBS 339.88]